MFLKPDRVREDLGFPVKEKIIPDSARASKYVASYVQKGDPMKPCHPLLAGGMGVTVHNTYRIRPAKGTTPSEQYTRATLNCNMGGVVVHYYVDDVEAWQNLREDEQGWHAADGLGPGNTQTIAVEIIMDGSGDTRDINAEENGAILVADILRRKGWGIKDVYQHHDWFPKKNCPLYIRPHWNEFLKKVETYLNGSSVDWEAKYYNLLAELNALIDKYEKEGI